MKIGHVVTDDGPKTVIFHGDRYYDLFDILGIDFEDSGKSFFFQIQKNMDRINEFVEQGKLESLQEITPNSFSVPVPYVNQIRDFCAFEEHMKNVKARNGQEVAPEWYDFPVYYYTGNSSLYPSDSEVPKPSFTSELDFELEIAAVIGKEGRDIPKANALEHVFGFVLINDWTARDQQRKETAIGLSPSKSKDFATTFGRFIVTLDEVLPLMDSNSKINSEISISVNGSEVSRNNLNTMYWTFQDLISWASVNVTLSPGDILMAGGLGKCCLLELGENETEWLKTGDSVNFSSKEFGELNSKVS